jgi:8-oxo-dGTP diphosphatase
LTDGIADAAKPTIAAAVVTHNGAVLLVRRRVPEGALSWQFPAGGVEPGESPAEAAVRETAEETGVVVSAAGILGERIHPATRRSMIYVACGVTSGQATVADPEEIAEVAWSSLIGLRVLVPGGVYEPVQRYLETVLAH